ncbi:3-hydroxyisobutyrate dehydrogenase [Pseudonocardia thermophila]|uniref:3-hydroxyisobutyrate dehydrogenase n=1 Tax=Pseudonocardia thermophila TaxID=1848 RepID=A0A1M6XY69_PSETH|nr:NAD(P)-binding domain-containing protein [Pseudonocardia thermophila]SHL10982.1 3-hydroxyisobutyrate dehydrogenase [Pseudonocardia thermophila]
MTDLGKSAVTVLGLGAMGTALAEALLAAGHPTTVWNRSPARTAGPAQRGAAVAAATAEAIAASRLIVVCLLDHTSVHAVLDGQELTGRIVVNLTSGTPGQARELDARVAERGGDHLDGAVLAVPSMIGTPDASVLYSGSRGAFDTHRPVLEVFGAADYVGADPGAASLQDAALLSAMYGQVAGVLHAFALVRSAGVTATEFLPRLVGWLTAMGGFPADAARRIDARAYADDVDAALTMQVTAVRNLVRAAREQGVSAELIAPLVPVMQRRIDDGDGGDDLAALVEVITAEEVA